MADVSLIAEFERKIKRLCYLCQQVKELATKELEFGHIIEAFEVEISELESAKEYYENRVNSLT